MLTITIIFTVLVALWGHPRAIAFAAKRHDRRRRPVADRDCTPAGPASPTAADDH